MSRQKYANNLKEFAADILSFAMYMENEKDVADDSDVSNMMLDIVAPELHFYQEIADCYWFKATSKYVGKARDIVGVDRKLLNE